MPLTTEGKKVMAAMKKEYGGKKGESVFYASINAKKKGSDSWHKKSTKNYGQGAVAYARSKA